MRKIIMFFIALIIAQPLHAASIINDTETEAYLTELIAPIAVAADIPKNRLKIYIVNDDDFNAFVRGGEDVFIYTGLLKQIKSPDALQAVIAHELGHTIGGHMAQMSARMDAELKRSMLIQALGIGLMVAGGNPSMGMGVLAGAGGVATQSMLAFSRDEERIAANMGLDIMVRAGA
ncbi:MAG: M48 family metallopeptidase, partial [Candidatus Enterousia sp.]